MQPISFPLLLLPSTHPVRGMSSCRRRKEGPGHLYSGLVAFPPFRPRPLFSVPPSLPRCSLHFPLLSF